MRKAVRERRLKKQKKEKSSFFKQFKNSESSIIGNFEHDFSISINLLFDDLGIYFSNKDYQKTFISKKWDKWGEQIVESLKEILLDRIAKKYYNLDHPNINEQLIKRLYLNHLNKIGLERFEVTDEVPNYIEVKESDITFEDTKQFWYNYLRAIISIVGLEKELHKDIVLENVQKRWF